MRSSPLVHLVLFSAFPTLYLFARNRGEIPWGDLPGPLAVSIGATLVAFVSSRLLPGPTDPKAAVLSLVVLTLFGYGHAKRLLQKLGGVQTGYVLMATAAFVSIAIGLLLKRRLVTTGATRSLNLFAACLAALPVLQVLAHEVARRPEASPTRPLPEASPPDHRHPNILYMVLDGYSREDALRDVLGFDNRSFLRYLADRGFVVPPRSRSNYGQTDKSIASSLDMRLLAGEDRAPAALIDDNRAFGVLRRHHYRCLTFATGYRTTEIETADAVLGTRGAGFTELESVLFAMSPIPDTIRLLRLPNPFRAFDEDGQRARILYTLSALPETMATEGPVFVFAHVLAPHPPYVFGPQGQPRERDEYVGLGDESGWQDRQRESYVAQLTFLNSKLRETVDGILSRSREPPIVILQADHGSAFRLTAGGPASAGALAERFSILNAWFAPPDVSKHLYAGMTPVNTFRVLFAALFGGEEHREADRSFWSFDGRTDQDVTALVE